MVCAETHDEEDAGWAGAVDLVIDLEQREVGNGNEAVGLGSQSPSQVLEGWVGCEFGGCERHGGGG